MRIPASRFLLASFVCLSFSNQADEPDLAVAEKFITTFYSRDLTALKSMMSPDADSTAIIYYQGWAEGADYAVKIRRPCEQVERQIVCAITVTDDFGRAMGYEATDTFRMNIDNGMISAITFSGDDPPVFMELQEWIAAERPEVMTGPCLDLFAGGTTPHACAAAVAKTAVEFMATRN